MTSPKPYLLRAYHEWMVDNGLTPYLVVDAQGPGVCVPPEHVREGRIVLDISPSAVRELMMDNAEVSFSARFSGRAMQIRVPVAAVGAIYARENGQGMVFPEEPAAEPPPPAPEDEPPTPPARPRLTRVK